MPIIDLQAREFTCGREMYIFTKLRMTMTYNSQRLYDVLEPSEDGIPTLEDVVVERNTSPQNLDALVEELARELQDTLNQHVYTVMVKAMHQVVHRYSGDLSIRILQRLKHHLPEIINTAYTTPPKDDS